MTKQSTILWVAATLLTIGSAVFQRVTGPTYPFRGTVTIGGMQIPYKFDRSEEQKNAVVKIPVGDSTIRGWVAWKRYKTDDPWIAFPMKAVDGFLQAELPMQPPAGKLLYRVLLERGGEQKVVPEGKPVELRFKGNVPSLVLWPHILVMFLAMLFSTRAGLEFFSKEPHLKNLTFLTLLFLFVGGLLLGPLVQKFAFDSYWTGWPMGKDLTDNKTALAFLGWVASAVALYKSKRPKFWALCAAIILLLVFLIPHSVLGSEIDYKQIETSPLSMPR
jgi:hypothetical protein